MPNKSILMPWLDLSRINFVPYEDEIIILKYISCYFVQPKKLFVIFFPELIETFTKIFEKF